MSIDEKALNIAAEKLCAKPEWLTDIVEAYEAAKTKQPNEPWKPSWGERCTCGPATICPTCAKNGAKTKEQLDQEPDNCRNSFEKWHRGKYGYVDTCFLIGPDYRWEAWQEAWNSRPKRESGWQPIETAPKDGTTILGVCKGEDGSFILAVWWQESVWFTGWVSGGHRSDYEDRYVTHWMPLPELPLTKPTSIEGHSPRLFSSEIVHGEGRIGEDSGGYMGEEC